MTRPRFLVTLPATGEPADTGKRLRAAATIRALARYADLDVVLLSADQPLDARPVPADVSVHHWSIVRKKHRSLPAAALRMMLQLVPLQTAVLDWAEMRAEIVRLGPESFSLVWFGALDHFVVLRDLVPDIPAVVDYDDVEPAKIAAFLAVAPRDVPGQVMRAKARVERVLWRRLERLAKRHCAAVIVCSDHDVHRLGGGRTVAVPNTYPDPGVTAEPSPGAQPEFVLIANYSYKPNIDAARFVARDVLPTVRRVLPNAVVHIAGHESVRWLADLRNIPGIRLTGAFPDVRPFLNGATAVIVPVRYGGGTRLKIIEAWAYSMPVVSTTLGAEGLGARSGVDILLADSADDFAAACVRVASERQLHTQLASAGRRHYESAYQPVVAEQAIAKLLTMVLER